MKYLILLLLVSCRPQPKYSYLDNIVFTHDDSFYEKNCGVTGVITRVYEKDDAYTYYVEDIVCYKNKFEVNHISLYVKEENVDSTIKSN